MTLRVQGLRKSKSWRQKIGLAWGKFSRETNFPVVLGLLVFCLVVAVGWRIWIPEFFSDLWVEFCGLIFDIVFILLIFSSFEHRRQKILQRQTQHDIIEDYKRWDSEEARFRLAGAIRRLNKMGVTGINLSGARISDFSFSHNNISSLKGSTFYDGTWGERVGDGSVVLKKVDFSDVDCWSVVFSPYDPFSGLPLNVQRYARFEDCYFINADLREAKFNGASLKWTEAPPDSHDEIIGDPETGDYAVSQVSWGPFDGSDLTGASFVGCVFENADFRGATGVDEADFSGARGLETCEFDDAEIKAAVLSKAKGK